MDEDPNPAIRAELEAAIAVLDPQIRGCDDWEHVSITPELKAKYSAMKAARSKRKDLCQAVLNNLDKTQASIKALNADGYPDLPVMPIDATLMDELQGQNSDLDAAAALFTAGEQASKISVELGAPTAKGK